jgi:hypothetical protein
MRDSLTDFLVQEAEEVAALESHQEGDLRSTGNQGIQARLDVDAFLFSAHNYLRATADMGSIEGLGLTDVPGDPLSSCPVCAQRPAAGHGNWRCLTFDTCNCGNV